MFKIVTERSSFEVNKYSIYGKIHIEISHHIFPDAEWTDIVSSVLSLWADSLLILLDEGGDDTVDFYFMDGSYYFTVSKNDEVYILNLYENRVIVNSDPMIIDPKVFRDEIIRNIEYIIEYKVFSKVKDVKKLVQYYNKIKKVLR